MIHRHPSRRGEDAGGQGHTPRSGDPLRFSGRKLTEPQRYLVQEVLATFGRKPFAIYDGEVCPIGLPGVEVVGARKDVIARMVGFGAFVPTDTEKQFVLADWALQYQPFIQAR